MFPWDSRRKRRNIRDRRRPDLAAGERLETRDLMAFNALGYSLPDLTVDGFASSVASWGGPVTVTVNLHNIGASTIQEPLVPIFTTLSSADSAASTVAVYATKTQRSLAGAVQVGTIAFPAVSENGAVQLTSTFTLPSRPSGFPGDGGKVYLTFRANASGTVFEQNTKNDLSKPVKLQIQAPLPELAAVGLDVPPVIQPGDTIQPNIRIANFGPADTFSQGPVTVALVASTTPDFTAGSTIVASYTVANIPGASEAASQAGVIGDANLDPQLNVVTIAGAPVTLPTSPSVYYIGVVIDPSGTIKQLAQVPQFTKPANPFTLAHVVGPPISGLPPAGVLTAGGVANVTTFPFPIGGALVGGSLDGTTFPSTIPPYQLNSSVSLTSLGNAGNGNGITAARSLAHRNGKVIYTKPTTVGRRVGVGQSSTTSGSNVTQG